MEANGHWHGCQIKSRRRVSKCVGKNTSTPRAPYRISPPSIAVGHPVLRSIFLPFAASQLTRWDQLALTFHYISPHFKIASLWDPTGQGDGMNERGAKEQAVNRQGVPEETEHRLSAMLKRRKCSLRCRSFAYRFAAG